MIRGIRARVIAVTAFVSVSSIMTGCGGTDEREYALPGSLCGVEMAEELYEPLFPSGSEMNITQSFERFDRQPSRWCRILVDDEIILHADATGGDFEDAGSESLDMADAERVEGEFEALVWPGVAMATAPCTVPGFVGHNYIETLTLVLETEHPGDDGESRRVLAEVIQPLFAGALEMTPCEENAAR